MPLDLLLHSDPPIRSLKFADTLVKNFSILALKSFPYCHIYFHEAQYLFSSFDLDLTQGLSSVQFAATFLLGRNLFHETVGFVLQ